MELSDSRVEDIKAFWNNRADHGLAAGSKDLIAKQLAIEAIAKYICNGMRVMDAGCGNGVTAIELAKRYNVTITAFDFSENMIKSAIDLAKKTEMQGTVSFTVADIRHIPDNIGTFDLIYTEGVLINLSDWPSQKRAILELSKFLRPNGLYVMSENSQDGLEAINSLRERLKLTKIEPPWHNRYLLEKEIIEDAFPGLILEGIYDFTSTYYFLSRIVNAWLAAQEGEEPNYNSLVNQLALQLPSIGNLGQTKIWLWRKSS
jgi:ubiquinone/menaquinone biosynthesis C-methylase UbiE